MANAATSVLGRCKLVLLQPDDPDVLSQYIQLVIKGNGSSDMADSFFDTIKLGFIFFDIFNLLIP